MTETEQILSLFALLILIPSFVVALFAVFMAAWMLIAWLVSLEE